MNRRELFSSIGTVLGIGLVGVVFGGSESLADLNEPETNPVEQPRKWSIVLLDEAHESGSYIVFYNEKEGHYGVPTYTDGSRFLFNDLFDFYTKGDEHMDKYFLNERIRLNTAKLS